MTYLWLKGWDRTAKGKLSSTGISAGFVKPKRRGIPVFYQEIEEGIPDIIAPFQNHSSRIHIASFHGRKAGGRRDPASNGPFARAWLPAPALASFVVT